MDTTHDASQASIEDGPISPELLAAAVGAFDVVMFAIVGQVALGDPIVGGLAGVFVGGGIYLLLPVMLNAQENDGSGTMESPDGSNPVRGLHRLAAGFALSVTGLLVLATQLADVALPIGLGGAALAGAVIYLAAGFALPNANPRR
ncbi:hypothetical protein [Halosolutus gelatinilyticus]|uniref:hypothetical protein n=1 Tax=Halosolutus gelatinilyticus TaxID=2931975 RepID=UPI001FF68B94|nr:hypothetical protein [Halosolutus gelatinilyticus]